jgi:hypothetical protein
MIDDLATTAVTEPWADERIPPGFDAKRVYEHAVVVGGERRKRRRRGYAVGMLFLAATIIAFSVMHAFSPAPAVRLGPVVRRSEALADSRTLAALTAARATPGAKHAILAVGDSVMLGASDELRSEIAHIYVDAKISRGIPDVPHVLQQYKTAGALPPTVVIAVATNGTFTDADFDHVMRVLGSRTAVFLNARMPRPWESQVNRQLAADVKHYRNARLLDWHRLGSAHPGWFLDDGTHLTPTGVRGYETLIDASVRPRPR